MIRELWRRLIGVFFRSQPISPPSQPKEKSIPVNIGEGVQSPPPEGEGEVGIPETIQEQQPLPSADGGQKDEVSISLLGPAASPINEFPKWEIRTCTRREFDKVGRLFMEGGNMVIKVEGLPFYLVTARDVGLLCNGEIVAVRETGDHSSVGTARPSVSGRAVNFRIGDRLYTVPYRNFHAVMEGKARKAAVFAGNGRMI